MKIAALRKCSTVDYPGKIAAVVFTQGCNLNCFYCHNRSLIPSEAERPWVHVQDVLDILRRRHGLLEALVVTGGEPTLQSGLEDFLRDVRNLGFATKLDTNGACPDVLQRIIGQGLADFIAIDLKGPLARYSEICGPQADAEAIRESVRIVLQSGIGHEFRTTVIPQLTIEDLREMVRDFSGIGRLVLQQFRRPEGASPADPRLMLAPHRAGQIKAWAEEIKAMVGECCVRGID